MSCIIKILMLPPLPDGHPSFQALGSHGSAGSPGMLEVDTAAPVVGKLLEIDGIQPPGFCESPSLSRGCYNYFVLEADIKYSHFYFFWLTYFLWQLQKKKKKRKLIMPREGKLEMNQLEAGAAEKMNIWSKKSGRKGITGVLFVSCCAWEQIKRPQNFVQESPN